METIFTWLGSIILPLVAIIIAIWSSHRTSKDATRQVESIKQLAKIQIETTLRQIEVEIQKNRLLAQQAREEWQKLEDIRKPQFGREFEDDMKRKIMEERPQKQVEFYDTYIRSLNESRGEITKLKGKLK